MGLQVNLATTDDIERLERQIQRLTDMLQGAQVIPAPEWVSIQEAAKHHGRTARTIRDWIDAGKLEARGSGRCREVRITR
ncbi:MAG TPA: hypothetical protein DIT40_08850 [Alphaproteobacteria bacterium]|nr:hypothetical protein [Alphaproteobacteria bacterium]